jgi:acyl dehydratase
MTATRIDELHTLVGEHLGTSAWHVIDQGGIDRFAQLTRDDQWIHVDDERGATGPVGRTVARGYLTLSLCSWVLAEYLHVRGVRTAIDSRVRSPVPAGTQVRGHAHLLSCEDIPGEAQAVVRITLETDRNQKLSCVADVVVRYQT